ncbi:MAG: hypothetical protein MJK15_03170 [Colwellia sp.]|nr:hypothetical protein [Colwellia sp.]
MKDIIFIIFIALVALSVNDELMKKELDKKDIQIERLAKEVCRYSKEYKPVCIDHRIEWSKQN